MKFGINNVRTEATGTSYFESATINVRTADAKLVGKANMHHLIEDPEMTVTDSILQHIPVTLQHLLYKTEYVTPCILVPLHHHQVCLHSTLPT
jgi:hypothetical protein